MKIILTINLLLQRLSKNNNVIIYTGISFSVYINIEVIFLKIPALKINCDDAAQKYFIYRNDYEALTDNILDYNNLTPIAEITNSNFDYIIFNDDNTVQKNIKKNTNGAMVIHTPTVDIKTETYENSKGYVPYYTITIKNLDKPLYFYYRIIAENSTSSVSRLSDLATLELEQDAQDISLHLEKYENSTWKTIKTLNYNSENICKDIDIINSNVFALNRTDIQFNDKYVLSDNKIILNINNLWHKDNVAIHFSNTFPLRIACSDVNGNTLYTNRINTEKIFNPIDRLVILRKEYDGTDDDLTITNDVNVKQILRADGIYLNDKIYSMQFNEEYMRSDIYIVNSDNIYKQIKVIDNGIYSNKTYKYTFICYDHTGNQSKPYTIIHEIS